MTQKCLCGAVLTTVEIGRKLVCPAEGIVYTYSSPQITNSVEMEEEPKIYFSSYSNEEVSNDYEEDSDDDEFEEDVDEEDGEDELDDDEDEAEDDFWD
jgi:hypothetical protein